VELAITAFLGASNFPVRLASLMGVFCSLLTLAALGMIAGIALFTDSAIPGWAFIMTAIFFGSGIQLLCLGILGEYISRIHAEIKHRPAYFAEANENSQREMKAA
jgi:dolichol-phosphate mannosyltransferase